MAKVIEETAHWLPVDQWPSDEAKRSLLAAERITAIAAELTTDVEKALAWLDEAKEKEVWKYAKRGSFAEYMESRGLNEEAIDEYRRGLAILKQQGVTHKVCGGEALTALADHGGDRRSEKAKGDQGANSTLKRGSTQATYLARRLLRDRPDLFERLEAGEFTSVRAAALEAGIVKPTFTCPIDPERAARLIRKHFAPSDVDSLIDALQGKDA